MFGGSSAVTDLIPCFLVLLTSALMALVEGQAYLSRNRIIQTSATCDQTHIYFRVNFERPFRGLIYTEGMYGECVYVNGSSLPQMNYDVKIPLNTCNTRQLRPSGAWENSVIVQQDGIVLESSDRKFLINCHPAISASQDGSFTVSFGGVTVDSALSSTQVVTGAGSAANLDYSVQVQNGEGPGSDVVKRALNVGEPISYVVIIPNTGGTDVRIGSCWAKDGISSIQLSDERGCSVQDRGNIWNEFKISATTDGNGKIFSNDIRAWAFPTSNRVDIYCNLHLCNGRCPVYSCARGKRSATRTEANVSHHSDRQQDIRSNAFPQEPSLDSKDEVEVENGDDQVLSVEGTFEVGNLGKIDVLNAQYKGASRLEGPAAVITGGPTPITGIIERQEICVNRLHFGIVLGLLLLVLCLSLSLLLVFATKLCKKPNSIPTVSNHHSMDPANTDYALHIV